MLTSQQTALMEFFEIGIGYNSKSWQLNEKGNNKKLVHIPSYVEYRNKTLPYSKGKNTKYVSTHGKK